MCPNIVPIVSTRIINGYINVQMTNNIAMGYVLIITDVTKLLIERLIRCCNTHNCAIRTPIQSTIDTTTVISAKNPSDKII